MVMAAPSMHDSAVLPCFHDSLAFLHRHFPPQSPPSHPQSASPSQQQPSLWYCSTVPKLHLPAAAPSRGICVPVWGMYGCSKDRLIPIPFRPSQISCFTLSLKCFSSDADNCPSVGIGLLLQFPHPPKGMSSPTNTPVFSSLSFILLSFAWVYIFFLLVKPSCLLSAGVLHAFLCLKLYS